MPRGDGTGPIGLGPGTGRGRGWCRSLVGRSGRPSPRRMGLWGALVPLAIAFIGGAANRNGLLRSLGRKLLGRADEGAAPGAIEAKYTVLDDNKRQQAKRKQRR